MRENKGRMNLFTQNRQNKNEGQTKIKRYDLELPPKHADLRLIVWMTQRTEDDFDHRLKQLVGIIHNNQHTRA